MKILLIKCELLNETDRWVSNPLGIMYLASVARKLGHEVDVLDLRIIPNNKVSAQLEKITNLSYDIIGLSALSHAAKTVALVSDYIKSEMNSLLILGGPLASANTKHVLENYNIDLCILGEGEVVFENILKNFSKDKWRDISGIAYKYKNKIIINSKERLIADLDSIPFPAWDLIDFKKYAEFLSMSLTLGQRASIYTSRGCPYKCIYCQHYFGDKFRYRSVSNVIDEIDLLYNKYKIRKIEIIDDIFNFNRERAVKILKIIRDDYKDLKISFPNAVRGDILDESFIRLLKESGCEFMPIAVESGSKRVQKLIRKNLDIEKILHNASLLRKYKIPSLVCFMVGFPGETDEEIEETFKFSENFKGLIPVFSIVTPLPGTKLWEKLDDNKKNINPEEIDGVYGIYSDDSKKRFLIEKTLNISRKHIFLNLSYWFIIKNEILFRFKQKKINLFIKLFSILTIRNKRKKLNKILQIHHEDIINKSRKIK